jgi:hypothetical protein
MFAKRLIDSNLFRLLTAVVIIMIFAERPLSAYADPGGGLLAWQLLGALAVGAVYRIRHALDWLQRNRKPSRAPLNNL